MDLFLDVCAKKRITALATVHLTLPPITPHLSLYSYFLATSCTVDPCCDTRNTCVLEAWVIVRTWTMTGSAATSITLFTCVDESWQSQWASRCYCYPDKDIFPVFKTRPNMKFTCPNNDKSLMPLLSFLLSLHAVKSWLHAGSKLWKILDKASFYRPACTVW